jgi:hypothetical protein
MPTPDNILDHLRRTKSETLITIPALLQIWAQDKEAVDFLATLKMIVSEIYHQIFGWALILRRDILAVPSQPSSGTS